jgi:hypothetical protein
MKALPIRAAVVELRREPGRVRVVFARHVGIYYLEDKHPERERLAGVLEKARASGEVVVASYDRRTRGLSGVGPS